jgi:type IV pilus assembly protein PilV
MRQSPLRLRLIARRATRGVGLIDALIALAILAFGLLALTRFQGRMLAQTTEVQSRWLAMQLADELLSTALVDGPNLACYSVPAAGVCNNATAKANTAAWAARAIDALPGASTALATVAGTGLTVTLTWTGKDSQDPRQLTVQTDVQ